MPAVVQEDRTSELSLLIQAVDELQDLKLTEWVWGGETAWMQKIVRSDPSAHSRIPPSLSKEW